MQQELARQRNAALVGRDAELDLIASQLAQAQRGQCRVVLLAGEPGIGKTHLLDAVVARAVQDGALARRGGASDAEGSHRTYRCWKRSARISARLRLICYKCSLAI